MPARQHWLPCRAGPFRAGLQRYLARRRPARGPGRRREAAPRQSSRSRDGGDEREDRDGRSREQETIEAQIHRSYRSPGCAHHGCRYRGATRAGDRRECSDWVTNGKMAVHNTALAADTPAKIASAAVVRSLPQTGHITVATEVDHRTPINRGGDPFPPLDQLASPMQKVPQPENGGGVAGRG